MIKELSAELFRRSALLACDFDNTVALTSETLPGGRTVEEAYEVAIYEVLGREALQRYLQSGGLQNRAPIEIVSELKPNRSEHYRRQKTEDLVEKKVDILLPQFGQRLSDGRLWPSPVDGMPGVWHRLYTSREVNTAIISSGHNPIISRFFDIHDLPQPNFMVTDDDMRPLMEDLPSQLCVKPSRLLIDLAHHRWLDHFEFASLVDTDPEAFSQSRKRITYAGDDIKKDGRLAQNAGVEFVHIPQDNPAQAWRHIGQLLVPETLEGIARV